MIQLYTGEGKGKTTAAVGLAVRAAGTGLSVLFTQFMKGNDSGELSGLSCIPKIRICRSPKNFGFYHKMTPEDKKEITQIHNGILQEALKSLQEDSCQVVILDEITYPVTWGLVDMILLQKVLEQSSTKQDKFPELILTGRNPHQKLINCADYITQMNAQRHPYEQGIGARRGIEF